MHMLSVGVRSPQSPSNYENKNLIETLRDASISKPVWI